LRLVILYIFNSSSFYNKKIQKEFLFWVIGLDSCPRRNEPKNLIRLVHLVLLLYIFKIEPDFLLRFVQNRKIPWRINSRGNIIQHFLRNT
jgi:hypothetical protein